MGFVVESMIATTIKQIQTNETIHETIVKITMKILTIFFCIKTTITQKMSTGYQIFLFKVIFIRSRTHSPSSQPYPIPISSQQITHPKNKKKKNHRHGYKRRSKYVSAKIIFDRLYPTTTERAYISVCVCWRYLKPQ